MIFLGEVFDTELAILQFEFSLFVLFLLLLLIAQVQLDLPEVCEQLFRIQLHLLRSTAVSFNELLVLLCFFQLLDFGLVLLQSHDLFLEALLILLLEC